MIRLTVNKITNYMKPTKRILVASLLIMAGILGGCGEQTFDNTTIHVGGRTIVQTQIDPHKDWDGWYTVRYGIGETLFKLSQELQIKPWIASGYERIDDKTWRIHLKPNVTFSNGRKVTPEDVIASLKRSGEQNNRAKVFKESTMTAEAQSILIVTKEPYELLINDLSDPFATILDVADTKNFNYEPIATGPFVIDAASFEPNKYARMVRNENYWDGKAQAAVIDYRVVSDMNLLYLAMKRGELDIALDLPQSIAKTMQDDGSMTVLSTVQPRLYNLYFNMDVMTDKAVREAVIYGIDKEAIGVKQLQGSVYPTQGAFPDFTVYNGRNLQVPTYNPTKARAILAADGYQDTNGDGIVEKYGKPLKIVLSVYQRLAIQDIATEMQSQLRQIGIDMTIDTHEKSNYFKAGKFEMGIYAMVTTATGSPYPFLNDTMSQKESANFGHYHNEQVDTWLHQLSQRNPEAVQIRLVHDIQEQALNDAAYNYLGFHTSYVGLSKHITGFATSPTDYYQMTKDLKKE